MLLSRLECSNDVDITNDHITTININMLLQNTIRLKVHSTQRDWTSGDGVDGPVNTINTAEMLSSLRKSESSVLKS